MGNLGQNDGVVPHLNYKMGTAQKPIAEIKLDALAAPAVPAQGLVVFRKQDVDGSLL
jgi:hypothetical protein